MMRWKWLILALALMVPVSLRAETITLDAVSQVRDWSALLGHEPADIRIGVGGCLLAPTELPFESASYRLQALENTSFDAVCLSGEEELENANKLKKRVHDVRIPVLSIAVPGAEPYLINSVQGIRMAMLGFSGSDESKLKNALDKAGAESDLIILLADLSRPKAVELCQRMGNVDLCLLPSGHPFDPDPLEIGGTWFVQVARGGVPVGRISFRLKDNRVREVTQQFLGSTTEGQKEQKLLRQKHDVPSLAEALFSPVKTEYKTEKVLPEALNSGKIEWLLVSGANRGVKLTVRSASLRRTYGPLLVSNNNMLLVLDCEWQNVLPLEFVYEREIPTAYHVPRVADHVYAVYNDHRLSRLTPEFHNLTGHLPDSFSLERFGSSLRGNLVFEVTADELNNLELRYYDFAHGHIRLPIIQPETNKTESEKVSTIKQSNQMIEAEVYGLDERKNHNSRKAPPDMCYRLIDFLARSLYSFAADATAFDPDAQAGEKIQVGTVADWLDSRHYMQLVVDGEYAYSPLPSSQLSAAPRFLPDLMTGDQVVFLTPDNFQSLELWCDFPHARIPETNEILHPKGLTFALQGKRPTLQDQPVLASIDDDCFQVHILSQKMVDEFAGNRSAAGKHFLVLDITVKNQDAKGEFFQTVKQFYYVDSSGNRQKIHGATFAGLHPPMEQLWVPAKQQRSFEVIFEVEATESTPRLAYHGLSLAKIIHLPHPAQGSDTNGLTSEALLAKQDSGRQKENWVQNAESFPEQVVKPNDDAVDEPPSPGEREREEESTSSIAAKSQRSLEAGKERSRELAPGERIFTTNQDFDQGFLFNLNHDAPKENQLQINEIPKPFPYVNVAASERGTVVRIDADTGRIVGEYRTAPEKRWRDPSRTTVDLLGNVWAGNREEDTDDKGSVVKIGLVIGGTRVDAEGTPSEEGAFLAPPFIYNTCVDRDRDQLIKTSRGLGNILPWPDRTDGSGGETAFVEDAEDECILLYQRTSGVAIRHVSVDADNNVWVGGYPQHPSFFEKLDGQTGRRLDTFSAAEIGCGGYGGLIDANGVLWSSSKVQDKLLRYDPHSRTGICIPVHSSYGLGIDSKGFIWNSDHSWSEIVKIDPEGHIQPEFPRETGHWAALRGVAVTLSDDNIWVANSNLQDVSRLDNQGNLRKVIDVEDGPTGVAVDHNGKVWATNMRSDSVSRIDPNGGRDGLGAVDLTVDLGSDAEPYNYSDMTGAVVAGATAKQGMWNLIYDSEISGTAPTTLHWNKEPSGSQPPGSSILVQVRAGETPAELSSQPFVSVENAVPMNLPGPYVEIRTILNKGHEEKSPVLSDLSIFREGGTGTLAVSLKGDETLYLPRIELILDASGSMRERKHKIDGKLKIEVAKEVLAEIIGNLDENTDVALRVYGRRIREGRPGDCEDTELLYSFGTLDKEKLLRQVHQVQALGTTPLAYSLARAVQDFPGDSRGRMIILITDGKEECGGDPAATAETLVQKGLDIRVNVVGFGLADEKTKQDMKKVAQITGGTYFDAHNRETLLAALQRPLSIPFDVFDSSGKHVAGGEVGQTVDLPVGEYTVRARVGNLKAEVSGVQIQNRTLNEVELPF